MAKTMTNNIYIKGLIHNMKMEENTSVIDHISAFDSLCSRLEAVGEELKDQDKALQLIWTLPDSYKTLVQSFMSRSSFTTTEVCQALSAEEMMRKRDRINTVLEGAFVAKGTSSNKGRKTTFKGDFFKCGQPSHCVRDCPRKNDDIREKPATNLDATATVATTSCVKEADHSNILLMHANHIGQG